jgi:hypothetical protein
VRNIITELPIGYTGFVRMTSPTQEESHSHHLDFSSLRRSADEKCYICLRLRYEFHDANVNQDAIRPVSYRFAMSAKFNDVEDTPNEITIWFINNTRYFGSML